MTAYTQSQPIPATLAPETTIASARPRTLGFLFLGQFAIFLVALIVLGRAINWPASLDEPPSVILPLIAAQRDAVALGYASYFLSALLLVPIALLLGRRLGGNGALTIGTAFGVIAGLCKLLGILRWLVAMPALADTYLDPAASASTRDAVAVSYELLNRYAGGIGELLGVMLFSGLWTVLAGVAIARRPSGQAQLPRWLGGFGIAAGGGLLVGLVEVFGVDLGGIYLTGSGVVWQLWMIAMGVALLRMTDRPARA